MIAATEMARHDVRARIVGVRFAVILLAVIACGRSKREHATELGVGDGYLVLEDDTLMLYTATRVDNTTVSGELFGSLHEHPRDHVIPERSLGAAHCPRPGGIALVKTTRNLWDFGLSVGSDGERCYLQERARSSQRDPKRVYELPVRYAQLFGTLRADLEARWARRSWVLKWPPKWRPEVGEDVVMRVARGLRAAKVIDLRPGAVKLARAGAFAGEIVDEWRSLRQIAPVPKTRPAGDAVACSLDDAHRCVALVPAATAELPVVALADADVIGRSQLVNDLLLELGAIHTHHEGGKVVWVRPDGTPVLEARYEIALAEDGQGTYSIGWVLSTAEPTVKRVAGISTERVIPAAQVLGLVEALARVAKPVSYDRLENNVVFVYEPRVVLPANDARRKHLSAAARRVLEALEAAR